MHFLFVMEPELITKAISPGLFIVGQTFESQIDSFFFNYDRRLMQGFWRSSMHETRTLKMRLHPFAFCSVVQNPVQHSAALARIDSHDGMVKK